MVFIPQTSFAWRMWRRLVRTELAYFAVPEHPKADVLKLSDLPAPLPGAANQYRPTILIDLIASEDELWQGVAPKSRKVIRQAEREGIASGSVLPLTEEVWDDFLAAYWKLWHRKQSAGALGIGQLRDLIAQGQFDLTVSRSADGHILSWHAYVKTPARVRLHTTISDMDPTRDTKWNNMVGRAHRLHHWRDMLRFKAEGAKIYDFGGVYRGTDDQEQLNIARFKQSFGGHFADTYDAVVPLTLKGHLALSLISHIGAETRAGGRAAGAPA